MAMLSLTLLACGDDDSEPEDTTTTTEEPEVDDTDDSEADETDETDETDEADEADETDDAEGDNGEAGVGAVTAPGTELAIGDSAVVPYDDSEAGLVEITVTEIVPGDKAAFDESFGEDAATIDPFYIRYTVTLVSIDAEDPPGTVPGLRGTKADGGPTGTVIAGSLDDCESDHFGSDAAVGDTLETCRIQGVPTGETVDGAKYNDGEYFDAPVSWTA